MMAGFYDDYLQLIFKWESYYTTYTNCHKFYPADYIFDYKVNDCGNRVTNREQGGCLVPQIGYQSYKSLQNLMNYPTVYY